MVFIALKTLTSFSKRYIFGVWQCFEYTSVTDQQIPINFTILRYANIFSALPKIDFFKSALKVMFNLTKNNMFKVTIRVTKTPSQILSY